MKQNFNHVWIFGMIAVFLILAGCAQNAESSIIVKQTAGLGLVTEEYAKQCSDRAYVNKIADYVIEGTITKVQGKWNNGKTEIYTYSNLEIEKYVKGEPFKEDVLVIVTPGGTVGDTGFGVEGQLSFSENEKVRVYFQKNNGGFTIVCPPFGVEKI